VVADCAVPPDRFVERFNPLEDRLGEPDASDRTRNAAEAMFKAANIHAA
jgi:hypothetical protein